MINYKAHFLALVFCIPFFFFSTTLTAADPTAKEIIQSYEKKMRGNSSQGRFEITIIKPRTTRTFIIDSWEDSSGKRAFLRIIKPKKDSGTTFLKIDQNLWQYIPKIGKEIKVEGSLMQDSWMGSDMTNDDLVRATSIIDDFSHSFLKSSDPDHYRIQLIPKPEAAVIWSRLIIDVRKSDIMPVKEEFYDHKNRLARTMDFSEYKTMGGRYIPTYFTVKTIKADKVISSTSMKYINVIFDRPISDYIFSKANLRR